MNICFDEDVDTADAVQLDLLVLIIPPITHAGHVFSTRVVLLVAFSQDNVFIERGGQSSAFIGLDPRVVVEATFNIPPVFVSMEPNVWHEDVSIMCNEIL